MTDMQVKAYANQLQSERNAIEARTNAIREAELAEKRRSNLVTEAERQRSNMMNEALTQAADAAKYGYIDYMGPQYTPSGGGSTIDESPQGWWNLIREMGEQLLGGPLSLIGKLFK